MLLCIINQVLKILKRKDDLIGMLQSQLEDSTNKLQNQREIKEMEAGSRVLSEGKSRDYWTGSTINHGSGPVIPRDEEVQQQHTIDQLKSELAESRSLLSEEQLAHAECRSLLKKETKELEAVRLRLRQLMDGRESGSNVSFSAQNQQELRGLREKTIDQEEQIQVIRTLRKHVYS